MTEYHPQVLALEYLYDALDCVRTDAARYHIRQAMQAELLALDEDVVVPPFIETYNGDPPPDERE